MSDDSTRTEVDTIGPVEVAATALWGAQSQRSLENFAIGTDTFTAPFICSFAQVKKAAAQTNQALGLLSSDNGKLIERACDEIITGKHNDQFPLSVWQTGSGTQTHMNVNEVIANRSNELAGKDRGAKSPVHPNDHVNMSQSTNDVFPTVMHVATRHLLHSRLYPVLESLIGELDFKAETFSEVIKTGRTHMMDATPVTLGQEFSSYARQLRFALDQILHGELGLRELAIGGTAVGTGLNSHPDWPAAMTQAISRLTQLEFVPAENRFSELAAHDALLNTHGQLNGLAAALFKMANDIRLMNSGPRCGLSEIHLPANEPGSSIMPGKVNPTQVEALTMVCLRVMGNNTTVSMAGSQGHFQLNVYKPLIIHCVMESITLLTDAMDSFNQRCLTGLTANEEQLRHFVSRSLMLVTALSPIIGYDKAAQAAKYAQEHDITLKEAIVTLKFMSAEDYDREVRPEAMLGPSTPGSVRTR
ncbi:MAG: class II fumarate hydratase [Pseudohongiellaceae bacterium]